MANDLVVDLKVSCRVDYTLSPSVDYLQGFFSQLHQNLEVIKTLLEGKDAFLDGFQLIHAPGETVAIRRVGASSGAPLCLSIETLKNIVHTLSFYKVQNSSLSIPLQYQNFEETQSPEYEGTQASTASIPQSERSRENLTITSARPSEQIPPSDSKGTSLDISLNDQLEHDRNYKNTTLPVDCEQLSNGGKDFEDFLTSPREPDEDLPPEGLDVVKIYKLHLKNKGYLVASSIVITEQEYKTTRQSPVFTNTLSFKLDGNSHSYTSSTRFNRKSDAMKNVALQVCVSLGLVVRRNGSLVVNYNAIEPEKTVAPSPAISMLTQYLQKRHCPNPKMATVTNEFVSSVNSKYFSVKIEFSVAGAMYDFVSDEFSQLKIAKLDAYSKACRALGIVF